MWRTGTSMRFRRLNQLAARVRIFGRDMANVTVNPRTCSCTSLIRLLLYQLLAHRPLRLVGADSSTVSRTPSAMRIVLRRHQQHISAHWWLTAFVILAVTEAFVSLHSVSDLLPDPCERRFQHGGGLVRGEPRRLTSQLELPVRRWRRHHTASFPCVCASERLLSLPIFLSYKLRLSRIR